jgi:Tfp pilus assembly protein PilV
MKRKLAGDTLIEVMFAFAVLATIASVSFSGALSAYKASVSAQWRTEASFVAQYESDALLTYRKSLDWDTFINNSLFSNSSTNFCVVSVAAAPSLNYWQPTTDPNLCNGIKKLLANVNKPDVSININKQSTTGSATTFDKALATITVSWVNKNGQNESVKDIILLTKEQQ